MTAGRCLHTNGEEDPLTASLHLSVPGGFIFSLASTYLPGLTDLAIAAVAIQEQRLSFSGELAAGRKKT